MKKNISKTAILFIISITTFVIVAGIYYLVFTDIVNTKESAVTLADSLSKEKLKRRELEIIRQNIKSTLNDNNRLASIFVPYEGVVDFIQLLESLGKDSGLEISTDRVESIDSEELRASNKEIISISLKTEGSWRSTERFLNYLENLPYKISIHSVSFTHEDSGDSEFDSKTGARGLFWKGSIELKVFKSIAQI